MIERRWRFRGGLPFLPERRPAGGVFFRRARLWRVRHPAGFGYACAAPVFGGGERRLQVAASDFTLHPKKECVAMSDSQKTTFDPNELSERLSSLRARFDEFRGRL